MKADDVSPHTLNQSGNIFDSQSRYRDRTTNLELNDPRPKTESSTRKNAPRTFDGDGHDRQSTFDSKNECASLERLDAAIFAARPFRIGQDRSSIVES